MGSVYGGHKSNAAAEAASQISSILEQIQTLYARAAYIATEHELEFYYDGPAGYGDSGNFDGARWEASSNSC